MKVNDCCGGSNNVVGCNWAEKEGRWLKVYFH